MSIISKPTIQKGQANELVLSKAELASQTKVLNDSYFSDQSNWKQVALTYESDEGKQYKQVVFDASQETPVADLVLSEKARDNFIVKNITITDFDGGYLKLERGDLTTSEFDIAIVDAGGDIGAIYTAFNYLNTLRPEGLDDSDRFGNSVAISDGYMVVGALGDGGLANSKTNSGAVYVFKINQDDTITQLEVLRPEDLGRSDQFGNSVAISGGYITVGAIGKSNTGAVYVFKINQDDTITQLEVLRPEDLGSSDQFGNSVAISGGYIAVGTINDDGLDNSKYNSGAVYVFKINQDDTITQLEVLRPEGLDALDNFGTSVDISNGYIAVGTISDEGVDNNNYASGATYVFKINQDDTITQLEVLRPEGLGVNDAFGNSVAISDGYMVVGALGDDGLANSKTNSGAVYVFKINQDDTITQLEVLRPEGLDGNDLFATSVDISDGYIVVSATDDGWSDAGATYVFKINQDDTITQLEVLRPEGLDSSDTFGRSVAISNGYITVGATGDDGLDNSKYNLGAVYVFKGVE